MDNSSTNRAAHVARLIELAKRLSELTAEAAEKLLNRVARSPDLPATKQH